ncbi:CoA transferase [Streptantibioticus rubrisoli]|uniref:CoA transferase n=1 Tax=Streptantibioticus rubrisoli TaxID=1387313 RepID=A0ABT1P8Q2_9ACTN|nr:CoA transferase [Streptantibioticus rubrisoli]MCQ4041744.1 CoA transferase [Streptantibioticus rubrisoli]
MTHDPQEATGQAWSALGGAPRLLERVSYGRPGAGLPARLPVRELARATVAVCSLAAAELAARRTGRPVPAVRVDDGAVATSFTSERHLRIGGREPVNFAPLSGFWRAADGWVRTHANYPHHRARLLACLGIRDNGQDTELAGQLAAVVGELPAEEIQERVYAAGGLAVAVRTAEQWARHPAGRAAAAEPLVRARRLDGAPRRPARPLPDGALLPGAGVRVLDLTRVIAGPVAGRTLALLGADVLRIDSPRLPESADAHADTGFGKRSARLDLAHQPDRAVFDELLDTADVVLLGYRPGALDRLGLSAAALLERQPGLVVAELGAWGHQGPWARRRGFDSLVQAATGIAMAQAGPDGRPGALPAQALDHGTGHLVAAAVLRALTEQHDTGGGAWLRFSLAATGHWLTHGLSARAADDEDGYEPYDPARHLARADAPIGRLVHALPPVSFVGGPANWACPPGRWGADQPVWVQPLSRIRYP